jgi:hypothetical protein
MSCSSASKAEPVQGIILTEDVWAGMIEDLVELQRGARTRRA